MTLYATFVRVSMETAKLVVQCRCHDFNTILEILLLEGFFALFFVFRYPYQSTPLLFTHYVLYNNTY